MAETWAAITAEDYARAFAALGGSFATHPRVIALISDLSGQAVSYVGLRQGGVLVAALALWEDHVVATKPTLHQMGAPWLLDIGDSEIILPLAPGLRIDVPFQAQNLSALHQGQITNLDREPMDLTLAKGLAAGISRQSPASQRRRGLEIRAFQKIGGSFRPMADFSALRLAEIYADLYARRWNGRPLGADHLAHAFDLLSDFLCGDILFHQDRPVAFELTYRHETPGYVFVNSVQAGQDFGLFDQHSLGSILYFHNLGQIEAEARGKPLRYNLGRNDAPYKTMLAVPMPAFRTVTG